MNTIMGEKTKMPTGKRYGIQEVREEFRSIVGSVVDKYLSTLSHNREEFLAEAVSTLEHVAINYAKEHATEIAKEIHSQRNQEVQQWQEKLHDATNSYENKIAELTSEIDGKNYRIAKIERENKELFDKLITGNKYTPEVIDRMEDEIYYLRSLLLANTTHGDKA